MLKKCLDICKFFRDTNENFKPPFLYANYEGHTEEKWVLKNTLFYFIRVLKKIMDFRKWQKLIPEVTKTLNKPQITKCKKTDPPPNVTILIPKWPLLWKMTTPMEDNL